ncbi:hypothetical protein D9611_003124 [Ephemerocybe angulata]|uniref:Uncharacterized protein n=1 Tax=Ephemerocybe angulata TaxID=980116 RepID=A0A8H5FHC7_9AGAR|nr:hypothetical protein D9611_003124 [Tulosesus angulatus]
MPPGVSEVISTIEHRPEEQAREKAATLIQRTWRGKRGSTDVKEEYINEEARWDDALANVRMEVARKEAAEAPEGETETPKRKWKRAVFLIGRLLDQHPLYSRAGGKRAEMSEETREYLKQLEGQHWLELIDRKHRYGSNLKVTLMQAKNTWDCCGLRACVVLSPTMARIGYSGELLQVVSGSCIIFKRPIKLFSWRLDAGEGKDLDLKECSRERLESERIIYLSTEQRLNYLAKINDDGKLVWAKNNQPIDTTAGEWKDTEDGRGIISQHLPATPLASTNPNTAWPDVKGGEVVPKAPARKGSAVSGGSRLSAEGEQKQKMEATHYAGGAQGDHSWQRYLWRHLTLRGLMEKLLRKTVAKNTWMYISDMDFNIFIGIKETGYFQHSSFLAGGVVTSAGLIKVKNGQIRSISPLSGHYRTSVDHFHRFIDALREKNVDLSRVSMTKAEIALWGIEHLGAAQKKQKAAVKDAKKKAKAIPGEVHGALASSEASNSGKGAREDGQAAGSSS